MLNTCITRMAAAIAIATCAVGGALAQPDYPNRTIKIVIPVPPGPTLDSLPRIIGNRLSQRWGVSVVVENIAGAAQNLGAEAVAKAEPDGYTLLVAPKGPLVISQHTYPKLGFDPSAFVPVSIFATQPTVLLANSKRPFSSLRELIAFAKANPGKINYGSPGTGGPLQLMFEIFDADAGIRLVHVPYKGMAPAMTDLLAGHIDLTFDLFGNSLDHVRDGRLKALGVTSKSRLAELPDVPAIAESFPDFIFAEWFAFVAPPKTSPEIAAKLSQAIAETIRLPDVAQRFRDFSVTPVGSSPAETAALLRQETEYWRKAVAQLGIRIE
jgi:tripartite-type tricarboxylate transporter receptor subunit TctC